jgi:hypothetical protein
MKTLNFARAFQAALVVSAIDGAKVQSETGTVENKLVITAQK